MVTHELTDHLLGGYYDSGPTRLETAGLKGIPQVVVPGCIDFIAFSPPTSIPNRYKSRRVFMHTPEVAVIRTNKEEMETIGRAMATKLNRATGRSAVIIPKKGFSPGNREGRDLFDPAADRAFVDVLRTNLKPLIRLIELDLHVNDPAFAEKTVELLYEMMEGG